MEKTTHKQLSGTPPAQPPQGDQGPNENNRAKFRWMLMLLPLGYLWFRLISNLQLEWNSNPQYSYGLVVPLLVAGLVLRRWHQAMRVSQPAETRMNTGW